MSFPKKEKRVPAKSSFMRREVSMEDVIIQQYQPKLSARVNNTLENLSRQVSEAETLTTLGVEIQFNGATYRITPKDLETHLDEFREVKTLAVEGRKLLKKLGYLPQRQNMPAVGVAPVGATVDIAPITTQLPGHEPLTSIAVTPK